MPKVSVIVPVFGVEKYIERCVRSLFEQTLDDIEYLFIDDCTPDRSIDILKQVLEEYPLRKTQVIIHRMEQNSGQAAVRKWGMQNATGEYVIHCDSDDWVDTDMYKTMYEKAINENLDMVLCDYVRTDGVNENRYKGGQNVEKDVYLYKLFTDFANAPWHLWIRLVHRDIIHNKEIVYPVNNMGEDMALSIQMVYYSKSIGYVPRGFYYYYINRQSITNQSSAEKIIEHANQWAENVRILDCFFENKKSVPDFINSCLVRLKLNVRNYLLPIVKEPRYYCYWKKLFPEINSLVYKNKVLTRNEKIKFYLVYYKQWLLLKCLGVIKY